MAKSAFDEAGDSDELQALFDNVSVEAVKSGRSAAATHDHSCAAVFQKVGHMTRQLHDTLGELGYHKALQDAVHALPDATIRLPYVGQMSEQAASRVLKATAIAKRIQDSMHDQSSVLGKKWDQVFSNQLSVEEFKRLAAETCTFLHDVPKQIDATTAQLTEIRMAQDFQDPTGRVIKKMVDLAQKLETQLLQILIESTSTETRGAAGSSLNNGLVISAVGGSDVLTNQERVEGLLQSLGF